MSNLSAPVRDQLYREGIALGDFVVNELTRSSEIAKILNMNDDLIEMFESRLKEEVSRFRGRALQMMKEAEFIDVTPIVKSETPEKEISQRSANYSVPSPAAVSQPMINLLKSMDLSETNQAAKRVRKMKISSLEFGDDAIVLTPSETASELDDLTREQDTALSTLFPASVSEIKIVSRSFFESSDPFRIYGVLESAEVRNLETPRRKRRKELSDGYFDKDGNYQALIYGGYAHLCSGALEWPFKIAEVRFKDFYGSYN